MRLVRHMVGKDVRRLALPVALWMGLMVTATLWLRGQAWDGGAADLIEAANWIRTVAAFSNVASLLMLVGGVVLAGYLALEDCVVGSDSFWQTRPISGRRLLTAKLAGAILLLVAAPTLVLVPVWALSGLASREILQIACLTAMVLAGIVLGSLTLASLVEHLGVHVFSVLVTCLVGVAVWGTLPEAWVGPVGSPEVARVRDALTVMLVVPALAFVLTHQFLTRQSWQSWTMLGLLLVAIAGVRVVWRWDLRGVWPSLGQVWPAEPAEIPPAMAARPVVRLEAPRNQSHRLLVDAGQRLADGSRLVPWSGRGGLSLSDGRSLEVRFEPAAGAGEEIALEEVGFGRGVAAARWPMTVHFERPGAGRIELGGAEFSGRMRLMRMRARVIAELPVQRDATWAEGVRWWRVMGWTRESPGGVLIEEREARTVGKELPSPDGAWLDYFVMVNRKLGRAQPLRVRELGSARLNGIVTGLRVLELTEMPAASGWRDEATIIKVRFEREARFERMFTGVPLVQTGGEERP